MMLPTADSSDEPQPDFFGIRHIALSAVAVVASTLPMH
jgi:hypothetical protein